MIDTNTDTKDRVLKEDQLLMQTLTAMNRIDNDISQIYSPLYAFSKAQVTGSPNDQDQNVYSQEPPSQTYDGRTKNGLLIPQIISDDRSSIQFLTTANRRKIADSKESRYAWIRYSLQPTEDEEDKKTGGNDLVRQILPTNIYGKDVNNILKDPHAPEAKAQVVLSHVKSLEFSFWDERSKKYVASLQELNENKNLMREIKLSLVWIDETNHEQTLEKNFRILYPVFLPKQDDLNNTTDPSGSFNNQQNNPGSPNPEPNSGIVQ